MGDSFLFYLFIFVSKFGLFFCDFQCVDVFIDNLEAEKSWDISTVALYSLLRKTRRLLLRLCSDVSVSYFG